jgi:hypothetical protein
VIGVHLSFDFQLSIVNLFPPYRTFPPKIQPIRYPQTVTRFDSLILHINSIGGSMKSRAILASATLLLFGTVGALTATAQSQDDSKDTTAKQDAKDAGHDTKNAAKKAGSATKKGTKKAVNKTAQKTDEGAQKVEDKTKPN